MFPARIWREKPQRYRLEGAKCKATGNVSFPPRLVDGLSNREFEKINLPRQGTVLTYTIIHTPPTKFEDEAPYAVGIINLGEVNITCQIVDIPLQEIKIGLKVRLEFRRIQKDGESGVLCYGYKAVPCFEEREN
jgi:hypothetical protein